MAKKTPVSSEDEDEKEKNSYKLLKKKKKARKASVSSEDEDDAKKKDSSYKLLKKKKKKATSVSSKDEDDQGKKSTARKLLKKKSKKRRKSTKKVAKKEEPSTSSTNISSRNGSLRVTAGGVLLLVGFGGKVAQLHLVLVLLHQLQLGRVAVLQEAELSLNQMWQSVLTCSSPCWIEPSSPTLPSALVFPFISTSISFPSTCIIIMSVNKLKGAQMYLSLEVGGERFLARGVGVDSNIKIEVHLAIIAILWLQLQFHLDSILLLLLC